MGLYKYVTGQKLAVFAWDTIADAPKAGDAANITAQISKDGGAAAATNDTNPTELDATDHPGVYIFDLTQAETNADMIVVSPVSATAGVVIDPQMIFTFEPVAVSASDLAALLVDYDITPVSAMNADGELTITIGATLETTVGASVPMIIPATWEVMHLMIKHKLTASDEDAKVHILVTNGGDAGDGLQLLNGAAGTAADGSLAVNQGAGTVAVFLADDATAELAAMNKGYFGLKWFRSDGESGFSGVGVCNIEPRAMLAPNA